MKRRKGSSQPRRNKVMNNEGEIEIMDTHFGHNFRQKITQGEFLSFIGVYDVFSASIAAKYYDGIFVSGFSFAASHYGLPDIGFIAWSDIVAFAQRLRTILPRHHILVDIDDGYCDVEVACHVVSLLEASGASGVILEDQKRPRKCGHFDGKQLIELEDYIIKLKSVLATRREMVVIARTDATDVNEITRRVEAMAEAGADAILVDGLKHMGLVKSLAGRLGRPFAFNQIAGGKSPLCSVAELKQVGVSLVIYSTPCLFAAQKAIDDAMRSLKENDGLIDKVVPGVKECTALLNENLERRDK